MVDYKPIPEERYDELQKTLNYAFNPHEKDKREEEGLWPGLGDPRGLFEGKKLLTVSSIHPFESHIRGDWLPTGGISAVATPPENRHKGYIKKIMIELLRELRDDEVALSALWPFYYPFYEKLGWKACDSFVTYEFSPDVLEFSSKQESGRFRQITLDNYQVIEPIYHEFVRNFNLPIKRSPEWWDHHKFNQWDKSPYCYAWEKEGELLGYVLYSVEKGSDEDWKKQMQIEELIYTTEEAFYQLLRFLYNHGSQVKEISLSSPLPAGLSLLDLVEDPREVKARHKPGLMVRCVDVKRALEALPFREDLEGELVFTLEDPLLEENDGRYSIRFNGSPSGPSVEKLSSKTIDTDISLDVGTLTQLYTGYLSPKEALSANKISIKSEKVLDLLNQAFPKKKTFFSDGF